MKFTSKLAAALALTCMLSGCGGSGNTIATLNSDYTITADKAYEDLMKTSDGKNAVFNYIVEEIISANYPVTDAMTTDADLKVQQLENSYTSYYGADASTYLNQALQQNGFENLDAYRKSVILGYQMREFLNDYINQNMDTLFEDYYNTCSPRYVSHILVLMNDSNNPTAEELEKVDTIKKALADGQDFASVARAYSDDSTASKGGALGLCDKNTSFVPEFLAKMMELKEGEVSEPTKTDYGYHIITVTSTSKEEIKQDDSLVSLIEQYDQYLYYKALRNYEITFNDETIKELYESTLDSYLKASEGSAQ